MTKQLLAFGVALLSLSTAALSASPGSASSTLVDPKVLIVEKGLDEKSAAASELAARRYDTFWNTGEESLERLALSPTFTDRTLPPGRAQGIEGPIQASRTFRKAVPDLSCEVEQMLVVSDRVVSHMRCIGHFTGTFTGTQGKGQAINFIATDIYRIADGKIAEDWHLEDNYTLLSQFGLIH